MKFSVGRILESDILGVAATGCNDGNVKGFVGYKYLTYGCYTSVLKFVSSAGVGVAQPRTRLV